MIIKNTQTKTLASNSGKKSVADQTCGPVCLQSATHTVLDWWSKIISSVIECCALCKLLVHKLFGITQRARRKLQICITSNCQYDYTHTPTFLVLLLQLDDTETLDTVADMVFCVHRCIKGQSQGRNWLTLPHHKQNHCQKKVSEWKAEVDVLHGYTDASIPLPCILGCSNYNGPLLN